MNDFFSLVKSGFMVTIYFCFCIVPKEIIIYIKKTIQNTVFPSNDTDKKYSEFHSLSPFSITTKNY